MRGLPSIDVTRLTSQAFGEPISGRFMGFACVTGNPRLGSWLRVEPMPMQFWIMFIVCLCLLFLHLGITLIFS